MERPPASPWLTECQEVFGWSLPASLAWVAPQDLAGPRRAEHAVFHYRHAVDNDPRNAFGIVVRVRVRADVLHVLRVEHRDVGDATLPDAAAIAQSEPRRGHGGHLPHRLLEG